MAIKPISFDSAWLVEGQAHLVLAQPAPYPGDVMFGSGTRTSVVTMLQQLLSQTPKLKQLVTQDRPAILALPEVALSFADWVVIDDLVRSYPSPLILISGFSLTSGALLCGWLAENTSTTRHASWRHDQPPSDERLYNGGWCWVHTPEKTECVAFLKLSAEQRAEAQVDKLDQGRDLVCLEFADLIVFPVICSDFLQVEERRTFAQIVSERLSQYDHEDRKVLVVGLIAQPTGNVVWRTAITDVARQTSMTKVNVCLVNWAYDFLEQNDENDSWRIYSGVYLASQRQPSSTSFNMVKRFSTDLVHGAVTRVSSGCVVGGPVRWTFGAATNRNIWTVSHGYALLPDGSLVAPCCDDPLKYELTRIVRRELASPSATQPVIDALKPLRDHIAAEETDSKRLMNLTLFGGTKEKLDSLRYADDLNRYSRELALGFKALGIAALSDAVEWQFSNGVRGQLQVVGEPHAILVWSSPDSAIAMKQELDRLRINPQANSPIIIFSKTLGGPLPSSQFSHRRIDIGASPREKGSITEPKSENVIQEADLDGLINCLAHASTDDAKAASASLIADCSDKLKAKWEVRR